MNLCNSAQWWWNRYTANVCYSFITLTITRIFRTTSHSLAVIPHAQDIQNRQLFHTHRTYRTGSYSTRTEHTEPAVIPHAHNIQNRQLFHTHKTCRTGSYSTRTEHTEPAVIPHAQNIQNRQFFCHKFEEFLITSSPYCKQVWES
jgi:hypothetical protein